MTRDRAFRFLAATLLCAAGLAQAQVCPTPPPAGTTLVSPANSYYAGTGAFVSSGSTSVPVGGVDARGALIPFAAGDVGIVIQMQGADIDASNNNRYGDGIGDGATGYTTTGDYAGGWLSNGNYLAGRYEYVVAAGPVSGGNLPIVGGLANSYATRAATTTVGKQAYQVVRVAQFSGLILSGSLTGPAWNGTTGGVVAVDVTGSLQFAGGTIDARGRGFRGGGAVSQNPFTPAFYTYVELNNTAAPGGGVKGEGIAGTPERQYNPLINSAVVTTTQGYPGGDYARGAPGNAGGGSNQHNSGGGGGGNGGRGGSGGRSWNQNNNNYSGEDIGGFGGERVVPTGGTDLRLTAGGGGGSGDINNQTGPGGSGGAGGGIVLIRAGSISGYGTIDARGFDAPDGALNATDGAGGGGAGGTVLISANTGSLPGGLTIDVRGGKGGNNSMGGVNETDGPGGGGGGGRVYATSSGPFARLNGGVAGIIFNSSNPNNGTTLGATPGSDGTFATIAPSSISGNPPPATCLPSLVVTKATSTPVLTSGSQNARYTITVTNTGTGSASNVVVTDVLPAPFTYASGNPTIVLSGGATRTTALSPITGNTSPVIGRFTLPGTSPGPAGSVTITFDAETNGAAPGTYQNSASVTFADPTAASSGATVTPGGLYANGATVGGSNYNPASSTAEDVTIFTAPTVVKSFSAPVIATGATATLTVTFTNPNPGAGFTNLSVADNFPAGLVIAPTPGFTQAPANCAGTIVSGNTAGQSRLEFTGITLAAGASCQVQVAVTSGTAGPRTNTIAATDLQGDIGGQRLSSAVPSSAAINVVAPPFIAKSFSPNALPAGGVSTLRIRLENPGGNSVPLTGVAFTDAFPAGIQVAGTPAFSSTCGGTVSPGQAAGDTTLTLANGTLAAGGTCDIVVNVTKASASPAGGDVNTTGAVSASGPVALTGNTARETVTFIAGTVPPTLAKAFGAVSIPAGGSTSLTLTIQNPNAAPLFVSSFVDNFPTGLTAAGAVTTNTCALTVVDQGGGAVGAADTGIQITGGTLPANGTCTVALTVTSSTPGEVTNTTGTLATTTAPASNAATAKLAVLGALTAQKSFTPAAITVGGSAVMRITLVNPSANTVPVSGVAFTDAFPAGMQVASPTGFSNSCGGTVTAGNVAGNTSVAITGGLVPVGGTCEVVVNVTATTTGAKVNSTGAIAASNAPAGAAASATLTVDQNINPPIVFKTFAERRINVGGTTNMRIELINVNPLIALTLGPAALTDTFPAGLAVAAPALAASGVVSASDNNCGLTFTGGTVGATSFVVNGGTIPAGDICVLRFNVTAASAGLRVNTTGNIAATGPVALTGNTASASLLFQNLLPPIISKGFALSSVPVGGVTRLTITIQNPNAADDFAGLAFTDTFPAGLAVATPANLSNACGWTVTGGAPGNNNINVTNGTLTAGSSCSISVDVVASGAAGNRTNTTSAVTATNGGTGNTATAILGVTAPDAPLLTKSFAPAQIVAGGTSSLVLSVGNPNQETALTGVAFSDNYPAGLTNVTPGTVAPTGSAGCAGNVTTVNGATPGASLAGGTIPAGGTCSWAIAVTKATAGSVINTTATAVTATGPAALTGNFASAALNVGAILPPQAGKSFEPDNISAGAISSLFLRITNPNVGTALTLSNPALTDTFPAGLSVQNPPGAVTGAVSSDNTCGLAFTGGTSTATNVVVTGGSVPPSGICVLRFNVSSTTVGAITNTTGSVAATGPLTGNTASAVLRVGNYLPPAINKAFSPSGIAAGSTSTLSLTITNPNPNTALTGVAFGDNYPAGLTNSAPGSVAPVGTGCVGNATTVNGATPGISLAGATVPAGGTCTWSATVTKAAAGNVTNAITTAVSATGPVALTGNVDQAVLAVGAATQPLDVTKTFTPSTITRGTLAQLTLTIVNPNAVAVTGTTLNDVFPVAPSAMTVGTPVGAVTGVAGPYNTCGLTVLNSAGAALAAGAVGVRVTGTIPASSSCTVTVNVVTAGAGTFTNTTTAITATGPAATTGNTAQAQLLVLDPLPPVVTKTFIPGEQVSGGTVRMFVEIRNPNPGVGLTGIALADAFPAGMQVAATPNFATDPAGACTGITVTSGNAAGNTALNFNALSVGASVGSCTISVDVVRNPANTGTLTNTTGNVTATGPVALTGNSASASVTWVAAGGLRPPTIAKSFSPAVITAGGTSTLTLTIQNPNSLTDVTGFAFVDNFPAGLTVAATPNIVNSCSLPTLLDAAGGALGTGDTGLRVNATTIPKGVTCIVSVDVTSVTAGNSVNTTSAEATTNAGTPTRGSATLTIQAPTPLTLSKQFNPAVIAPAGITTLTFTITNPNPSLAATGVNFTDTFPAGLVVAATPNLVNLCGLTITDQAAGAISSGDTALNVTTGVIPAASSCQVSVDVTKATAGSVTNTTGAIGSTNVGAGNAATASLDIVMVPLRIEKRFLDKFMVAGQTARMRIRLINQNFSAAVTQATFTDTFPAGLTVAAAPGAVSGAVSANNDCGLQFTGGTAGANNVNITAGLNQTIAAGATCNIILNVTAATPGTYTNDTSTVGSANAGTGNSGSDTFTVVTALEAPALAKSFVPASISAGGFSQLFFSLENRNGSAALAGIQFTDPFPAGLAVAATPGAASGVVSPTNTCGLVFTGGTAAATSLNVTGGTIPVATTCLLIVNVTSSTVGNAVNTTSTVTTTTTGAPTGPAATATLSVVSAATPQTLVKTFSPATINAGGTSQLRITVFNPNVSVPISNLALTDNLPANVVVASVPSFSNTCGGTVTSGGTAGNTSVAITNGVLTAGATCAIEVNVTSAVAGVYNNTIASNSSSVGSGTNPSATLTVVAPSLTKAFTGAGGTIDPAGVTTLTFTLANGAGNPLATGIGFTDALPSAIVVAPAPNVQTTCPAGGAPGAPGFTVTAPAGAASIVVSGASLNLGVASCTISVDVTSSTVNPSCAANPATHTNANGSVTGLANLANNVANTCLVVRPLPALTKAFGAATVGLNGTTTLAFTIDNTAAGAVNRTGLAFTDTLAAGLSVANPPAATTSAGCVAPTLTGTANGATAIGASSVGVNAGQSCVITFTVAGTTLGAKTNDAASITAITGMSNGVTPQVLTVLARPTAAKAFGATSIAGGGTTSLTITLSNANAVPITGVAFVDTFPTSPGAMTLANVTTSNTCGGTLTNNLGGALAVGSAGVQLAGGTIPAGGSCVVTVNVTASTAGAYTNTIPTGSVTSTNAGATTADASANLAVTAPATIAKAFAPAAIAADGTSTVTLTISNPNALALTGASFTDTLANMAISANGAAGGTCVGASGNAFTAGQTALTVTGLTIPASGSCTVTFVVTSDIPGAQPNATSGVSSAQTTTGPASNTANLTVTAAVPTIAKAFAPATIAADGTSTVTLTIANTNGVALTGAGFTDTLANMRINANGAAGGTCVGAGTNNFTAGQTALTVTGLTIPANGSCTVTFVVTSDIPGANPNTTSGVSSAQAATGAASNTANLTVTAVAPTIAKAFAPATIAADGTSTITFTLANTNGIALTGGAFTDTLANMAINANGAAGGTCTGAGGNNFTAGQTALSFTGLTIPANGSCTVTVVVTSDIPGTNPNTTSALTTTQAPASAASNTANLTVTAVAPTIAKAFAPATIAADGTSTITFTLANTNGIALTGGAFTDTLANMSISANGAAGGTCTGAGGNTFTAGQTALSFTGLTIPANGSCTVTVVVTSDIPGANPNTTSALTTTQAPASAVSNTANLTVTAVAPTIAKAFAPATIAADGTSTVTFTLANTNGIALTAGAFTDTLANMSIFANGAAGGTCTGAGTNNFTAGQTALSFTGLTIPANGSCTVTVVVTSDIPGTNPNTTSALTTTQAPASAVSNTANLTVTAVAPTIAKAFAPATIAADGTSTVTFTLANTNGIALTGGAFTDTLANMAINANGAAGGTCAGAGGNNFTAGQTALAFTGLTIPANGSCTVTVVVTSDIPGTNPNTTSALTTTQAPASAVSNTANLTVTAAVPTIAKAFAPATIAADGTSTMTLTITNTNGVALTGAGFTDALANMRINANGAAGGTCTGANGNNFTAGQTALTVTGLTIPANGSCTVTFVVTSDIPGANPNTTSGVSSAQAATGAASNTANLTVTAVAPTIAKAFAPATIAADGTSTITFTLANTNGIALTGGAFTDTLANMAINASGAAGGTCTGAGGNSFTAGQTALAFTGLTIPANGSCTVTVVVTSDIPGTNPNTTSALTTTQAPASAVSNTANLTVTAVAPTIAKAFAPATIAADGTSTITFTLANTNGIALTGGAFTDTLANMSINANGAAGGTCAGAAGNNFTAGQTALNVTGLTIPANGSCTVTFVVTSDTPGTNPNTTSGVSSAQAATGAVSNTANLTVTAGTPTIAKAFAPATIAADGTSTVTLTLANPNGIALTGAGFTDTLANMSISANAAAGGTCAGAGTNNFTAGQTALTVTGLTVPANGSCTVTFVVTSDVVGTNPNTTSGVSSTQAATGAASNTANLTVTAVAPTIAKAFAPATIAADGTSTITFTLANTNGIALTAGAFTDTLAKWDPLESTCRHASLSIL